MRELTMKLTRRILMGAAAGSFLLSGTAAMAQTELTFWSWRQEDKAFYQDVIKKFQAKEPGITVKFETYAPENYQTILSTALAAGRGPDVIQVRAYGNLETIATPGYLLALDKQNVPELANFPEAALAAETLRSDGKVYAVPFAMQAQLVVYNKKIFKDNGVNPPKTWDEMMALTQALKAKNITPVRQRHGDRLAERDHRRRPALVHARQGVRGRTSSPARRTSPIRASSTRSPS